MFRGSQIYIQVDTKRRLGLIAKGFGITVDELADNTLRQSLDDTFPELKECLSELHQIEEKIINLVVLKLATQEPATVNAPLECSPD